MVRLLHAVLAAAIVAAPPSSNADDAFAERASSVLGEIYTELTPGAIVVVSRDGEVLLEGAFGMADLELGVPMASDHVLRLASVTKQYAAAAMLKLVEDGEAALDDPISKFLPEFPAGDVTVHQLLNHTSGIKSYTSIEGYMDSERVRAELATDELIAVFADLPVDFAPGERWAYNNSGYVLVGALIEEISGRPWNEFLRAELLLPAGIENTDAYPDSMIVPGRVDGYQGPLDELERAPHLSMTQPHAAGALMATAADVDRWQRALHGGEMLGDDIYEKMITPVTPATEVMGDVGYGYGIAVGQWCGRPVLRHGGGIFGFATHALYLPEERLSVVVLANRAGPGWTPDDVSLRLAGLAAGRAYPIEADRVDWSEAEIAGLQGTYRIGDDEFRTLEVIDGELLSRRNAGAPLAVHPVEGDRLVFEQSLSWFAIERDESGEVIAMALHDAWGNEPERAEKIDDEIRERQAVDVPVEQLERLVGRYQLMPGFVMEARVSDGGLVIQATGQPAVAMKAESAVKFFNDDVGAVVIFDVPDRGQATGLTLLQGGQALPAPRIDSDGTD